MKYSYFMGCQVPARVNYCDLAVRRVTKALGIELIDLQDAGCCGCLLRSVNSKVTLALSTRIMALADKNGLDLVVLCNSCFATLREVGNFLEENPKLLMEVNELLETEGLKYKGKVEVKDILQIFYDDYGVEKIRSELTKSFKDLKVAVQYGCHLLRPSRITKFDNPEVPHILDELVEATGAKSIYWPLKLWCCGSTTLPTDDKLGMSLARNKLMDAKEAGADCIVTTCPSCQISFDLLQPRIEKIYNEQYNLPILYYPQLLGLAMDMSPEEVGLNLNRIEAETILKFLK
ncbi:CoB--CoM heterodisulfide reductase iron-sulfur subunit B family protein [Candidatus Bathyarchaeota archaeon]|nr:CoB--CoM heterodisulfide reductase iron-sulfur subunit B family protein [Candidatus Bathyarchaeota archaeon]